MITWVKNSTGRFAVHNILHRKPTQDASGIIDIDTELPGIVPISAQGLILTVERGYVAFPSTGTGCVQLRVMPKGYNLSNMLDRAKDQEWVHNFQGLDVVASHVLMPIDADNREFFWALQSTDPSVANKMGLIDLAGWVT